MEGVGWIAAIIIGGFAGWLAGKLMEARYGIVLNIVLGIVGSVVATAILAQFHVEVAAGRLGYFVTGFLGACLLIFIAGSCGDNAHHDLIVRFEQNAYVQTDDEAAWAAES
ncbi:membrane protein [Rhizobium yanglingense]|nr:membrane protein [Rhizobium yanglingense]